MFSNVEDLQLRDYLRPIAQRKWLILALVLLATGGTYAFYARQQKEYEASTKLLIQAAPNPLTPSSGEISDRTVQDQAALLASRDVATAVARRLGRPDQVSDLANSVTATASTGSNFVTVTARRSQARDAANVANAFARAFIQLRTTAARRSLQAAINNAQAQLAGLSRTPANQGERADLQDNIRQLRLTLAANSGSASQVDPAVPPGSPVAPHPIRNALLALLVSLIGALGLAYALEALDRRIKRLEDFSPIYGLPVIAVIPRSKTRPPKEPGPAAVPRELKEPVRQLRTSVRLAGLDQPFRRILVTGAGQGEGKSTLVRNLAIALREGGEEVAVVDTDLRRPALARLFGRKGAPGLTEVLTGRTSLSEALVSVPVEVRGLDTLAEIEAVTAGVAQRGGGDGSFADAPALSLLPAGVLPPDPQAVLAAERTRMLLDEVAAEHDVMLIDSPPLLHVSDAVALASWVDAVIVVGRLGKVTRDEARRLAEMLEQIPGAHPIGVVVNDVPVGHAGYGYAYGYGGAG